MSPLGIFIYVLMFCQLLLITVGFALRNKYQKADSNKKIIMSIVVAITCGLWAFLAMVINNKPNHFQTFIQNHERNMIEELKLQNENLTNLVEKQSDLIDKQTKIIDRLKDKELN